MTAIYIFNAIGLTILFAYIFTTPKAKPQELTKAEKADLDKLSAHLDALGEYIRTPTAENLQALIETHEAMEDDEQ